jgi:hypothetical protein
MVIQDHHINVEQRPGSPISEAHQIRVRYAIPGGRARCLTLAKQSLGTPAHVLPRQRTHLKGEQLLRYMSSKRNRSTPTASALIGWA